MSLKAPQTRRLLLSSARLAPQAASASPPPGHSPAPLQAGILRPSSQLSLTRALREALPDSGQRSPPPTSRAPRTPSLSPARTWPHKTEKFRTRGFAPSGLALPRDMWGHSLRAPSVSAAQAPRGLPALPRVEVPCVPPALCPWLETCPCHDVFVLTADFILLL